MYEKALDALATSPVARGVNRWLLAGDRDTITSSWLWRKELLWVLLALHDHLLVPDEAESWLPSQHDPASCISWHRLAKLAC